MSKKITSYFHQYDSSVKKQKTDNVVDSDAIPEVKSEEPCNDISSLESTPVEVARDLPSCWSLSQKLEFCAKNEWLIVKGKNLGCSICMQIGTLGVEKSKGLKISKEWSNSEVRVYGDTKAKQQMSLRKKIHDHKESSAHCTAVKITAESKKQQLETVCAKAYAHSKETTSKVFRTAYKIARKNQSFFDFESEINLQELNGVDMGRILHSNVACSNIVLHIANVMKKNLISNIIESKSKISILIDESTTLSQQSTLILYVRVFINGTQMEKPVNLFLDLIELSDGSAKGIFTALMSNLKSVGFCDEYLFKYLVAVACDGAAVMMGEKSGVKKLFLDKFPNVVMWHCANHRLELSVGDTAKEVSGILRFKSFIDKLYVLYHASPKNARDLQMCAQLLELQLLKIGRVLSTRWVSSSFRTVSAVWNNYEALVEHFKIASKDTTHRDQKERSTYEGLLKKITSTELLLDISLMCDALQELSELSLELQSRDINVYQAHRAIERQLNLFGSRVDKPGVYYTQALEAVKQRCFKGIQLHEIHKVSSPPIHPGQFYRSLQKCIEKRLMRDMDKGLPNCIKVMYHENWPADVQSDLTYGENEVRQLCSRLQVNERQSIRAFREFITNGSLPLALMPLQRTIDLIPISSSECERGFSQMNLIITPNRASLQIRTASALMFIRMVGPPLVKFDPTKYVDSWLSQGHHSAVDYNSKARRRDFNPDNKDLEYLWDLV